MCEKGKCVQLGFATAPYPAGTHMCVMYRDENERREVISKYIKSGLLNNEKIGYFADTMTPAEVKSWLEEMDVDVPDDLNSKQFSIAIATQTYCPNGQFVVEDMLEVLKGYYNKSIEEGFTGARATGEMSWALRGIPGSDRLLEYEALINTLIDTHPITTVCQYDVSRFDGGIIFDVLQVHPMLIVHGQLVKNPAYVTPDTFLKEFRRRA